jgi:hypothetical protein
MGSSQTSTWTKVRRGRDEMERGDEEECGEKETRSEDKERRQGEVEMTGWIVGEETQGKDQV